MIFMFQHTGGDLISRIHSLIFILVVIIDFNIKCADSASLHLDSGIGSSVLSTSEDMFRRTDSHEDRRPVRKAEMEMFKRTNSDLDPLLVNTLEDTFKRTDSHEDRRPVRNAEVDMFKTSDSDLDASVRSAIVDTFKKKFVDSFGGMRKPPRRMGLKNDTLANAAIREQIKDFLRRMKENERQYEMEMEKKDQVDDNSDDDPSEEDNDEEELMPLHFQSSVRSLKFPVHGHPDALQDTSSTVTFTADDSERPVSPGKRLEIRSAILRVKFGVRRNRLRHRDSRDLKPLNVSVYLVRDINNSHLDLGSNTPSVSTMKTTVLLDSFIISPDIKSRRIGIDLSPHVTFISDVMQNGANQSVSFEISVKESSQIGASRKAMERRKGGGVGLGLLSGSRRSTILEVEPRLDSTIVVSERRRTKRHATSGNCSCRRRSMYVSFADIGYDTFVASPDGFTAYYCTGRCPRNCKAATPFTNIKSRLHERHPSLIPEAVCAPSGYRPLTLMVFTEDNEDVEEITRAGMLVTGCRCF